MIGEGDSRLVLDILSPDLADVAFNNMRKEVAWKVMYHRGKSNPHITAPKGMHIVRYPRCRRGSSPTGGRRGGHCCRWKVGDYKRLIMPDDGNVLTYSFF